jgi:hypothetical protein
MNTILHMFCHFQNYDVKDLIVHHAVKTYEEVEVSTILNFGTRWRWSPSYLGRFTSGETSRSTQYIGGWVGPTADLDAVEKKEISYPYRESSRDS